MNIIFSMVHFRFLDLSVHNIDWQPASMFHVPVFVIPGCIHNESF